ncbi:MAG: 3'(2'),5'-bisphosphate nucleotidase CysQ [Pseudomonadota bacterium]
MSQTLDTLETIARRAGDAIMRIYDQGNTDVQYKDDESPLTAADEAAHQVIVEGLKAAFPDIPILSEEGADVPAAQRQGWNPFFLVDPLDGTKEFIKRNGEFTVNIALIEDSFPVAGVVHAPVLERTYLGDTLGARRRDGDNEPHHIHVAEPVAGRPWRVVGSRSHAAPEVQTLVDALGDDAELVSMGSSLKLCLVAEGSADLYPRIGPTMEWDTGAAHAVVSAAGGVVVDRFLDELIYNRRDTLLNPHFIAASRLDPAWTEPLAAID